MAAEVRMATDIEPFSVSNMEMVSREQIYSAMVVYGLLTYENGGIWANVL